MIRITEDVEDRKPSVVLTSGKTCREIDAYLDGIFSDRIER